MKKGNKFILFICCVSILTLVTGCGNKVNNGVVSDDNKIISCVFEEEISTSKKGKDEGESTKTIIDEITYDKDSNVISATYEETVKYDEENKKKIRESKIKYEDDSKKYDKINGITSSIDTDDSKYIINTIKYDYMKLESKNIKKTLYKKYIDSSFKLDVKSLKVDYEEQGYKCNIIE